MELFEKLLPEEYDKLLGASNKDVFDSSKATTLPVSREIALAYIYSTEKLPWFIDLLNINLNNTDLEEARHRIADYITAFTREGRRITENPDFVANSTAAT